MDAQVLRTKDVHGLIGVPVSTLRWWRHRGEGPPSYRLNGSVVYDRDDVLRWRDEQRAASMRGDGVA